MLNRRWLRCLAVLALIPAPAAAAEPPIPKRKPELVPQFQAEIIAPAAPAAPEPRSEPRSEPRPEMTPDAACEARLANLGVVFEVLPPIADAASCGVARPLRVTQLAPGVALRPDGILNCLAAEALARWARRVVIPAAKERLAATVTEVRHGSTYVCRTRSSGKPSEHARGNAVDIAGLVFAERRAFSVALRDSEPDPERSFQERIRLGACAYFTTVLGPGTDDAHAGHLHLDLRQRKRGYRICQ